MGFHLDSILFETESDRLLAFSPSQVLIATSHVNVCDRFLAQQFIDDLDIGPDLYLVVVFNGYFWSIVIRECVRAEDHGYDKQTANESHRCLQGV
jgi:hypothetical protein